MLEHFEIKFRSLTLKQLQLLDRPLLTCESMLQFELRNLFHMNYYILNYNFMIFLEINISRCLIGFAFFKAIFGKISSVHGK